MQYNLKNDVLELTADTHGAELLSVKRGAREYLWSGDPAFWGRRAPILFPFVGQVRGGYYRHKGIRYPMGQHGFARDQEFALDDITGNSLCFVLRDNEQTRKVYPFSFELSVTYTLRDETVEVEWKVQNPGKEILYFSIGAHPAFVCPFHDPQSRGAYALEIRKDSRPLDRILIRPIVSGGNVADEVKEIPLNQGRITPTPKLFDGDALILEGRQADEISLVNPDGETYLTVTFDTPLVGIWSPVGKNAPFICIEPWCGRTDSVHFDKELSEREYGNALEPGGEFVRTYTMRFRQASPVTV